MDLTHLLENNQHDQIVDGLPILLRLLENIVHNPTESRFRTINLDNRIVKQKLSQLTGIGALLQSIGFEPLPQPSTNHQMCLSGSVMTAQVKKYVQELQEILEQVRVGVPVQANDLAGIEDGQKLLDAQRHGDLLINQLASVRPYAQRIWFQSVLVSKT